MIQKRTFALLSLAVILATLVTACGGAATTAAPAAKFKMGFIVPGAITDPGWVSLAKGSMDLVQKDLGAEVSYAEMGADKAADYEKAFRDFGSQGYNAVLAHGNEYQDAAKAVAKDFPNMQIFISSSYLAEPTITGVNTDSSQPFYLMGMIAASMGKKAGLIGSMEFQPFVEAFQGFVNGAHSINPDYPVSIVWINSFSDSAAAKEAAVAMIKDGCDFIVPNADAAGAGAYQAIADTNGAVKTFGAFGDFTASAPQSVLANYTSDYGKGMLILAKQVKEGTYKGGHNVGFGFKDGDVMAFTYNDALKSQIPADVLAKVDAAKADIISGKINTLAK